MIEIGVVDETSTRELRRRILRPNLGPGDPLPGEGLGARLLAFTADLVHSRGARVLWCNARETAVGFYERSGFRAHGDVLTDERHPTPHVRMWLELFDGATSST